MTITINDMLALSRFLDAHRADKMSMKTAFKFNKLAVSLEPDMRLFQEKYQALVQEYADPNTEEGAQEGTFKIKEGKFGDYTAAADELAAVEIEVPDIKFSIEELEGFSASIEEMRPLMSFIED